MAKTLVIVESPAKAKTINKYLGSDYIVKASFGHVRDLPEKELGVDVENNFRPTYVVSDKSKKVVKELQELAKKCDQVLLAADPDREGEAIAWHLEALLKKHCSNIRRVEFNEITKTAVQQAVSTPHDVDTNMVNSQQTRRILDRVVGYNVSPWLSNVLKGKLSAGRVQSVALRVIVDREREIENFKPEEYWKIIAKLTPFNENFPFDAELFQKAGQAIKIHNKQEADAILSDLNNQPFQVKDVQKKERVKKPAAPFTTSTMQQESVRKLKWDSSRTMKTAQTLYEGVELSDGSHGLITYMRTDSTRINPDFQQTTLSYINGKWGNKYSPSKPNSYSSKGGAQDAHEAVRPTDVSRDPESIKKYLTPDQYQLYKLIWERYVASQMAPALYDTMTVITEASQYAFKSTGSSLKFNGFMVLYLEDKDVEENDDNKDEDKEALLPALNSGDKVKLIKFDPKQRFTKPPAKFTEATLIKELEARGVGRPSTYATIISNLKFREYVKVISTRFESTPLGRSVVDILVERFPDVMEIAFTAKMEDELDVIAEGKMNWVTVLRDFYEPFADALEKAKSEVKPVVKEDELSDKPCPHCGKPLAIKQGKFGKFLACTNYPDCKHTEPFIDESQHTGINCKQCGKPMIIKEVKVGKKKEKFLACTGYPTCKNTKPVDKKGKVIEKPKVEETDKSCPKCDKPMVLREGKNGKFYACTGYPDCKHTEQFIDEKDKTMDCDKCGKPMILKKGQYGHFYSCTGYPTCKNIISADKKGNLVKKEEPKTTDKECPNCGKPMVLRKGAKGQFYGCTGYPTCSTTIPYGETKECSKCGKPMVKRKGAKGEFWGCTGYPTCTNLENI